MDNLIVPVGSILFGIVSAWLTFLQLKKHYMEEIESKIEQSSLNSSKDLKSEAELLKHKIDSIESHMIKIEESVSKEIEYVKEAYKGEIKNLGEKIENLREEVRNQHTQLIGLLTKLIQEK
jgi:hypothetical protein